MSAPEDIRKKCIRPITLYNLNGTVYGMYNSLIDTAKAINCGEKQLEEFYALQTKKKLVKRQWIVAKARRLIKFYLC